MNKSIFTICLSYSCLDIHTSQNDGNTVEMCQSLCVLELSLETILNSGPTTDSSFGSKVTLTKTKNIVSDS